MGETCEFCGTGNFAHKRLVCGAQVARLEAEAAPLRAVLEQLKNVAKGIAHCYDELDEDERRELQQVCAESEAILLSPDAGKRPKFANNACNEHPDGCPEGSHRTALNALKGGQADEAG